MDTMASHTDRAKTGLERAKSAAGGPSKLSRALAERGVTVTPQAIGQWDQVPAGRVLAIEDITGVPRHELRPDLYPEPAEASE